jgi:hypothetical protein
MVHGRGKPSRERIAMGLRLRRKRRQAAALNRGPGAFFWNFLGGVDGICNESCAGPSNRLR